MFAFLMNHSAETGLLLFLICFVAIALFAATRTSNELDSWAGLPLAGTASHPDHPAEDVR